MTSRETGSHDRATRAMAFFRSQQKEHGITDISNAVQNFWDMKTILDSMNDDKELKKLIQFFMIMDDSKSFYNFKTQYDEYLIAMHNYIIDRRHRKALLQQTLDKHKQVVEKDKEVVD
ncbi:hypothetical protein PBI_PEREGRIN_94 [Rhodococcus phage Peregrin]|jgi:hypothetical protein|nr:hypothetical protein PBI_PEREGRIN_94 [Rhodococcus phage Peregrin]AWN04440.1 hypothetical protein PBI_GRAYSON_97 [Rhodococcus phage Grayson]